MKQKKPERILSHAALLTLGCTLELLLTPRRRAAENFLTSADAGVGAPPDASLYISLAFVLSSLHLCWARRAAASRRSNPAGTFMTPVLCSCCTPFSQGGRLPLPFFASIKLEKDITCLNNAAVLSGGGG